MKYKVNLNGRIYEIEVEEGKAMLAAKEGKTHHGGCGNCGGEV